MSHRDQDTHPTGSYVSRVHFCPDCRKPLRRIIGRKGPFWGCTGFPQCKNTLNDVDGKPSRDADEHYRCPVCTRAMVRTRGDKGDYWYCSGYDKGCNVKLRDRGGMPEPAWRCRQCGNLLVQRRRRKAGRGDGSGSAETPTFWGCSRWPECTSTYPDDDGRPRF